MNYFSEGEEDHNTGPVIITFEGKIKNTRASMASVGLKCIVRMKQVIFPIKKSIFQHFSKGTKYLVLPMAVCNSYSKMLSYIKTKFSIPNSLSFSKVKGKDDPSFEEEMIKYEQAEIFSGHKFGVLYVKAGQKDEDEMFANCKKSCRIFFDFSFSGN